MNRRTFHDRSMTYLFSFDLDLHSERDRRRPAGAGPITTLAQLISPSALPADEKTPFGANGRPAPVYNALQESRVLGEDAITGDVVFSQDHIEYPPQAEFARLAGRMVIRTNDAHLIDAEYQGVARARGRWDAVRRTADRQVETKAFITTHFETGSTKYQWLVKYRCLGFGRLRLFNGEPHSATFDLYALR